MHRTDVTITLAISEGMKPIKYKQINLDELVDDYKDLLWEF